MSDATLARMEHGKYVGVREESRRDGVYALRKRTLYSFHLCVCLFGHTTRDNVPTGCVGPQNNGDIKTIFTRWASWAS